MLVCILLTVPRMRHEWAFFLVAFVGVIGNVLFPSWYFQGIERMGFISIISGATRVLSAVLLFVLVHQSKDGLLAVAIQSLGMILAGVAGFVVCLRWVNLNMQRPSWQGLKTHVDEGWHLFVSTAAISLYTNTNVFLVGLLAGNVQAGYFSAADKLIRAISGLIAPINQAVFPHVNSLVRTSSQAALTFIAQSLKWMSGLTLVPVVVMFLLARPIAVLCFGHAGLGAVPVMRWIAPLPFLIAVSNVLGIHTMLTFGLDKQFSRIVISAGILNVFLGVPLILWSGAQGAGASVLIAETMVTLMTIFVLRRNRIIIPLKQKAAV